MKTTSFKFLRSLPFLCFASLLLCPTAAKAQLKIDVDLNGGQFGSNSGPTQSGPAVVGAAGDVWNGISNTAAPASGSGIALVSTNGAASGATLSYQVDGGYALYGSGGNQDGNGFGQNGPYSNLMNDYFSSYSSSTPSTVTLSGLPANTTFQVYLYSENNSDSGNNTAIFSVTGATSASLTLNPVASLSTFVSPSTNPTNNNYGMVQVTSSSTGTLSISFEQGSSDEADLDGFQLVQVSGGSGLLVNDGFDNGTRSAGTTAGAVSWYSMNGPGSDLAIVTDPSGINAGNALEVTPSAASEGVVAQLPSLVTLMNGQSISLSFQYRFTGTTNLDQVGLLRFGLLDSRGTPTAPPVGTGDNDVYDRVDDFGYYAATDPGLVSTDGTTLYKFGTVPVLNATTFSATMTYGPTLAGTTALQATTAGASIDSGTTPHMATMTITRSGMSLGFTVSIDGVVTASGTETAPLTYVFDSIAIATGPGSVPSSFIIDTVQVNYSSPSTSTVYPGMGVFVDSGSAGFDSTWTSNYDTFLSAMGLTGAYFTPNFCDGGPLNGASGSMTTSAAYEAGTQWGNTEAQALTPIASIPLANESSNGNESASEADFAAIVAGTYDSDYNSVFASYTSGQWSSIYLRIGWEQNDQGSTYPWFAGWDATCAADYVAAWEHVANLAHAYAAAHNVTIKTVWCPATCNWSPYVSNTYPADSGYTPGGTGDQYVDVVGIDVYTPVQISQEGDGQYYDYALNSNVATPTIWATTGAGAGVNRAHWLDFPGATYYGQFSTGGGSLAYAIAMAQAHLKPLCIPETGSNNNGNSTGPVDDPVLPLYLSDRLSQAIAQGTQVLFVSAWDGGGFSFTDGSRPNQLASWQQFITNMAGPQAVQASSPFVNGSVYCLGPQNALGSMVEVQGFGTSNGTNVDIWNSNGGSNQQWKAYDDGGGVWEFEPQSAPGTRMEAQGLSSANGTNVDISIANGGDNQKWQVINDGGGVVELEPLSAIGLRLDVSGQGTSNGTNVDIWAALGLSDQQYRVYPQ